MQKTVIAGLLCGIAAWRAFLHCNVAPKKLDGDLRPFRIIYGAVRFANLSPQQLHSKTVAD